LVSAQSSARSPLTLAANARRESDCAGERIGSFRHLFIPDTWEWSDELYRIHGYRPRAVRVTTAVVLSHKHPADRERVAATLRRVRTDPKPLRSRHRIIDIKGAEHSIVVVGHLLRNGTGGVVGTQGFYIDLTDSERRSQERITQQVAEVTKGREVIEHAKGMLMAIYGVDGEAAFEILKTRSQNTNIKLHVVAERLVVAFKEIGASSHLPARQLYDRIILTIGS
jgi:PAS domain S-box-containing protein